MVPHYHVLARFFANVIASISWPLCAAWVVFLLRREFRGIFQRIGAFKYKDLEIEFEKIQKESKNLPEKTESNEGRIENTIARTFEDQVLDLVDRVPSAAVLLAWAGLETAISGAVARLALSPDPPDSRSPLHNIEALKAGRRLSNSHYALLRDMRGLRGLRNRVAHEREALTTVTSEQARDYAETAFKLIAHFDSYQ